MARLLEKWFLLVKIGKKAAAIQLEKNYYGKINDYYSNIRKLGLEYEKLDYEKGLDFLLMTLCAFAPLRERKTLRETISGIETEK